MRSGVGLTTAIILLVVLIFLPVHADHHMWQFSHIYSNASGSIQYIEMWSPASGQLQLKNQTVTSTAAGTTQVFVFDENLLGETANASLLLATSGFSVLTGLEPDFIIPERFVPLPGGRLEFADNADSWVVRREVLPLNGKQALNRAGAAVVSRPLNFSGLTAALDVASWSHFDPEAKLLHVPVLETPGGAVANVSFAVDIDTQQFTLNEDFFYYEPGVSSGATPALLRQDNSLYLPTVLVEDELFELTLSYIGDDPVRLGKAEVLGVGPAPLAELSIARADISVDASTRRGELFYARLCASCHGNDGEGGSATGLTFNPAGTNLDDLRREIAEFMPYQNTNLCLHNTSDSCAADVTAYLLHLSEKRINGNE